MYNGMSTKGFAAFAHLLPPTKGTCGSKQSRRHVDPFFGPSCWEGGGFDVCFMLYLEDAHDGRIRG